MQVFELAFNRCFDANESLQECLVRHRLLLVLLLVVQVLLVQLLFIAQVRSDL